MTQNQQISLWTELTSIMIPIVVFYQDNTIFKKNLGLEYIGNPIDLKQFWYFIQTLDACGYSGNGKD